MSECPLCNTEVEGTCVVIPLIRFRGDVEVRSVHTECMLRDVVGGIGHLRDHNFWCEVMHDPDGGMSYRESALAVADWVTTHGIGCPVEVEVVEPADPRLN